MPIDRPFKTIVITIGFIVAILVIMQFRLSIDMRTQAAQTLAESYRAVEEATKRLDATIRAQRDAPIKVSLESLPPIPPAVCTVTMPPEKKRGRK